VAVYHYNMERYTMKKAIPNRTAFSLFTYGLL